MALIGLYVGVIPVAIGMLWLPWLRRVDARWVRFLLAFTVGLLAFLAIEALLEGTELAGEGPEALGGAALVWLGAVGRLPRAVRRRRLAARPRGARARETARTRRVGERAALLVALGIGLHNLGEGLAIGSAYAVGSLALGAALVVGFALHNTTEGLAIVAPVARQARPGRARSSCWACSPARPPCSAPGSAPSAFHPSVAAVMFGVGAGAIAQVIVQIAPGIRAGDGRLLNPLPLGGLLTGLLVMYATGLLVSV